MKTINDFVKEEVNHILCESRATMRRAGYKGMGDAPTHIVAGGKLIKWDKDNKTFIISSVESGEVIATVDTYHKRGDKVINEIIEKI